MNFNDLPLLSMLKDRLGYLNDRQTLIAQNVANSDTPGYTPKDLTAFEAHLPSGGAGGPLALAPVAAAVTDPAHIAAPTFGTGMSGSSASGSGVSGPWKPLTSPDSETRLDGNQVVLEEQMMKMNDARMNYNAAINFYQQSMNMLQTAIRIPGKG